MSDHKADWVRRLYQEQVELQIKIEKLKNFMLTDTYEYNMNSIDKLDLKDQFECMKHYGSILHRRIGKLL